jgi:hypothetical protein
VWRWLGRGRLGPDGFAGIGKAGWVRTLEAHERGVDKHDLLTQLAGPVTTGGA